MAEPILPLELLADLRAGGDALDRASRGPSDEIALLRAGGWLTVPLPIAHGGRGWGTSPAGGDAVCELLMALGGASLPLARLYEGHVNAIHLVVQFGDAAQRDRIAAAVHGGAMLGVWGADSDAPVTVAGPVDRPTLAGAKAFASGLGELAVAIVTATCADGLQMVIVSAHESARADHSAWDVDGMVGSRSGRFDCTGLPAGATERLGAPDALFVEPDFHGGVWRLAACYAGAMTRAAQLSAAWLERRDQLGAPLMQARLGMVIVEAQSAVLWARDAARAVERGAADVGEAVGAALFAREAVEQAAHRQLATVERIAGTAMHRRGSELGRLARDLRFYLRQADLDGKLALATTHWLSRRGDDA